MKYLNSFESYVIPCHAIFIPCIEYKKDDWDESRVILGRSDDNLYMAIFTIFDDGEYGSTTYISPFEIKPDVEFSEMNDFIIYLEENFDETHHVVNGLISNKVHIENILEHMIQNGVEMDNVSRKLEKIHIENPEDLRDQLKSLYKGLENSEKLRVYIEAEKFNM